MTTEAEIAFEAYLKTKDEGRPRCGECGKTDRRLEVRCCAECGANRCVECVTELQIELDVCSDSCGIIRAQKLVAENSRLRAVRGRRESGEDRQYTERRAA